MKVPFIDLEAQYQSIKDSVAVTIQEVLESCSFAGGPFVEHFENDFAAFCRCEYAIGVGSGTEALWLALLGQGIGPGDEVITVPNTFIATAEAISFCGAKPVFIDIDEQTYTMEPNQIEPAITPRTKAIIPVHLFGHMAEMDPIMDIARRNDLYVIEDACQAHGAQYKGRLAGSIGDVGCFSFYPSKNLGAFGEAGAIVTNDGQLNEKIKMLRDHGQYKKYHHTIIGWNARMDGLQGAILRVKLEYLRGWNERRRRNAQFYGELLRDIDGIILPKEVDHVKHVYHIYAICIENRDDLIGTLREKNIYCGIHYPLPLHLQGAYHSFGMQAGSLPVAEKCAEKLVSLPMFPELTERQIQYVAQKIKDFLKNTTT
jgi:dTDP-4-amino-4,6-dideoxygalactose transaminase